MNATFEAAASGKAIDLGEGLTYYDIEHIDNIIYNIEASFERVSILLNHQWPPRKKEYILSEKVSVLSSFPFITVKSKTGTKKYSLNLHEDEAIGIDIYKDKSGLNGKVAAHKCIEDKITKIGIKNKKILDTNYNGIPASTASFFYTDSSLKNGIALQCSYSQGYIIKFYGIAPNEAKAKALLNDLRTNVSIKD